MNTPDVHSLQSQIDRLWRKHMMAVAPVRISASDDAGPIHKSQVQVNGTPETIDNVATMHFYGFHSVPLPQSDATAIFISGQRANAIVVGTNHQKSRPRNFKAGEVALFTDEGDGLKFSRENNFSVTTKVGNISGSTSITLTTPDAKVTDKLTLAHDPQANLEAAPKQYVDAGDGAAAERIAALEARLAQLETRVQTLEAR